MSRILFIAFVFFCFHAHASVIVSRCQTPTTEVTQGSRQPFLPLTLDFAPQFKPSADYLNANYLHWLARTIHRWTGWNTDYTQADAARLGRILDDLRLYILQAANFHRDCTSEPAAIFPYVASIPPGSKIDDIRVGYKICEFYQDGSRQITVENTCRVIGSRPGGYSLASIDRRFVQFNETVHIAEGVIDTAALGASLFASGKILKVLRTSATFASMGGLTKMVISSVPMIAAGVFTRSRYSDLPIQSMADVRNSARLTFDGQMVDVVYVSMPIEKFAMVLGGYLSTIPAEAPLSPPPKPGEQNVPALSLN